MIICELCGSANREFDEQCRVCGKELSPATAPAPVAAQEQVTPLQAESLNAPAPAHQPTVAAPEPPPAAPIASNSPLDRLASLGSVPSTTVPPMYRNSLEDDVAAMTNDAESPLPSFGQGNGRLLAAREPVQLISANDLPDWIRQIAEADAAKAAEEAQKAPAEPEAQPDIQRALQPDAKASGPSTSWLTKSTGSLDASDPWDTPAAVAPAAPAPEPPPMPSYPTIAPTPTYIPETSASPDSGKRRLFGGSTEASGERTPIYFSRPFLIAAVAVFFLLIVLLSI